MDKTVNNNPKVVAELINKIEILEKSNAELKNRNKELEELLQDAKEVLIRVSNESKTINNLTNISSDQLNKIGISDTNMFLKALEQLTNTHENDETVIDYASKSIIFIVELEFFIKYYNSSSKSKLNTSLIEDFKKFRLNELANFSQVELNKLLTYDSFKKSPLLWISNEDEIKRLYDNLKTNEIISNSLEAFSSHFNGYCNLYNHLSFEKLTNLDLIYFFQELESKKLINVGFMQNYAKNIELHTHINKDYIKKSKSQSGNTDSFYFNGVFNRVIENCPNKIIVDEVVNIS
jgi:hypothetical protein